MFSLFLIFSLSLLEVSLQYSFIDYQKEFNKTYSNTEYSIREAAFNSSINYIQAVNDMNLSYTLGPTKWTDQSLDQIQGVVRINFNDSVIENYMIKTVTGSNNLKVSIPDSLDWVHEGKVSEVRDQGNCGSCWAFATASAVESLLLIHNQTNATTSTKYLLQCTSNSSCYGGYVNRAMELALKTGIPLQQRYPYQSFQATEGICIPDDQFLQLPKDTQFQTYINLSSSQIPQIVSKSPYVALMVADYGFMNYKSGIYFCNYSTVQSDLNHAVTVVGYDLNGNIMVKNSWSKSWGVNGFGWISGNTSRNCGINLFGYGLISQKYVESTNKYISHPFISLLIIIGCLFCL